jgi:hypothetical protein
MGPVEGVTDRDKLFLTDLAMNTSFFTRQEGNVLFLKRVSRKCLKRVYNVLRCGMWSSLFRVVERHNVVVAYRRFGTTYLLSFTIL